MYLERLLQINVATLAALGTLLLGMGQRSEGLSLLMLLAAIASVWLTDFTGWFRLSRTVANVAAVAAVVISIRQLGYYRGDVQILGIAPMLIYLQIILLFQQKDNRIYWQLITLSLLQVVVAAAFSQGVWFGVMLVLYMLVGFSALALLWLHQQWNRHRPAAKVPPIAAAGRRWPLASRRPNFTSTPSGPGRAGICRELFGRLGMTGLGTLVLTLLLFFIVPRFGRPAWRGANVTPGHLVGFSDKVILGELGEIIESREKVMRVRLLEEPTRQPYNATCEIYLRGAILTHYENGRWEDRTTRAGTSIGLPSRSNGSKSDGYPPRKTVPPSAAAPKEPLVLQEITIEPLDRDELFCVWPFVDTGKAAHLRFRGGRLLRPIAWRGKRFRFELGTRAFLDGLQVPITPVTRLDDHDDLQLLLQMPKLPELVAMADRWIRQSGLPPEDRIGRARFLQRAFRDPNRFQYSLQGQARDLSIDPIEDFLTHNPRGHCEYFATALALMLRSLGIPARVVVGYRCGEFHDLDDFYQVRQWHAHTWVEAYLRPEHLPEELLGDRPSRWAAGGWLRLEPTPAAAEGPRAGTTSGFLGRLETAVDWLQSLWAEYVMEMDRQRQNRAIYQPVVRFAKSLLARLTDPEWWRGVMAEIGQTLNIPRGSRSRWLWIPLTVFVALSIFLGGRWLVRRWRRWWRRLVRRAEAALGSDRPEVGFYRRMETLLARHGLRRAAGQTPREFAVAAGARIARATSRPQLASLPAEVVEAFYRVRFGRLPLDSSQTQAVEHALEELAACGRAERSRP